MLNARAKPPLGFWVVAVLLTLWGAAGCYACIQQVRLGAEAMGSPTPYQRELFASLPRWYNWVYALATGAGLAGGVALLARSRLARSAFIVSLLTVILQFGWLFAATEIVARMGLATAAGLPMGIVGVAVSAIAYTGRAMRRGWIG